MNTQGVNFSKPDVPEDFVEWLVSQLNKEAQPYHLEDDMRPLLFVEDETVRKKARYAAEHFYLRNHFELEQETCPLAVVDEEYGVVYAAALHKGLGMVVQHWFCDEDEVAG